MKSIQEIMMLWAGVMTELKDNFPEYHSLLKRHGYKACVRDRRNNSFGWCNHRERIVAINKYLHKNSEDEAILDTMWHEIAHAIDFCQRGVSDHGPQWKAIAEQLGAIAKSASKRAVKVQYKFVCAYRESDRSVKMLKGYHRKPAHYKPNSVMADTFMKGKKEESMGKVWLYTWEKWVTICQILGQSPYREEN